jgi:hypothetical protein
MNTIRPRIASDRDTMLPNYTKAEFNALEDSAAWVVSDPRDANTKDRCSILMIPVTRFQEYSIYEVMVFTEIDENGALCVDHRQGLTHHQAIDAVAAQMKEEMNW